MSHGHCFFLKPSLCIAGWFALCFCPTAVVLADTATPNVHVEVADFTQMREIKHLHATQRRDTAREITRLVAWFTQHANTVVPKDERLAVVFEDVDLAGDYVLGAMGGGDYVRVVKDIYPPRIAMRIERIDAEGISHSAQVVLSDLGFMSSTPRIGNDALRYEKRLLKGWLNAQFPPEL